MKKIIATLLSIVLYGQAQQIGLEALQNHIPKEYLSHPELNTIQHKTPTSTSLVELIHLRTEVSRTFLNTDKTKTTVRSSKPLHYKNTQNQWLSINYSINETSLDYHYPAQNPNVLISKSDAKVTLKQNNQNFSLGKNIKINLLKDNHIVYEFKQNKNQIVKSSNQEIINKNFFDGIDKVINIYHDVVKTDFVLKDNKKFNLDFDYLVFEEILELNNGQRAFVDNNQIVIVDANNQSSFTIHQPIVNCSRVIEPKFKSTFEPYEATYELVQIKNNPNQYVLKTIVESSWIKDSERVFPIIIDPVVTINNNNVVNSCFFPNYQSNVLSVSVPSGESVLSSNIFYDFVSTSSSTAWMSEQRSFVSSINGQTQVYSGVGNASGTYSYQINGTDIANGESTGQVDFTFNFARTWGGSGCNATFSFVNSRVIEVTYGTLEFGNGPVVINEYSASNRSHNDSFGRNEDWIELYNTNPDTYFNLSGYHLSNRVNNPTRWQITNGVIPPNGRIIIYCSNRDISSGMVQHANFNLTQLRPDDIVFSDPDGNIIESRDMYVTQTNHSVGRMTDGASEWGVFANATPGQPNQNGSLEYATKPTFNVEAGRYQNLVTIELSSPGDNEEIRFTTNGATPTQSSSLYSQPINITQTTVIRARSFSTNPNILPSFIETNTYFVNENSTLPTFSFSGDADLNQLFGGNQTLTPIGHFEYFENDGTFIDENLGDFDKHGNDSWNYPQRGVDFVSRDDHGYKRRLEHKFFATSDRTQFRRLMVKAAANDNYPHQSGGAHIRDSYIQSLSQLAHLDLDERSSTSVSLFVNGQYWGVYDLRERVDDNNFTNFYYGQDYTFRDSDIYLQFLKTWGSTQAHFGNQPAMSDWTSLRNYVQDNDMGVEQHINYVDNQLNIDSMIDYFVINSFVVSRDWLNYNTGWWRGTDPNGQAQKWRYILWDMEASTGHFTNYTGLQNATATAPPCQAENLNVGNGHTQIIRKLIQQNPEVRQKYITRYADLLNTHLSCERVEQVLDSMIGVITPEMPRQIARWGGNMATWQNNVQTLKTFLMTRCNHLMTTGLVNCYDLTGPFATTFNVVPENGGKIKMNSEWLQTYPFNAQIFGNIKTLLKAEASPGFVFSHWVVDGAVITPDATDIDIELMISQATSVTAHFNDPTASDDDLIYYWHFNNLVTPEDVTTIAADFSLINNANPTMTYTGTGPRDIDAVNSGSDLNLHQDEEAGKGARVRNPSDDRSLVFDLPTNGYRDIKFTYAVSRTNQGQLTNHIAYSIDGTNFIQTDLSHTSFNIETDYNIVSIDFTDITAVNNNPNFKIRITFVGNTTASNGNNRFDNITLKGVEDPLSTDVFESTKVQIYPNPFNDLINVLSNQNFNEIMVYDLTGKTIFKVENLNLNNYSFQLNNLSKGVYLLKIIGENQSFNHKIIKQ